MKTPCPSIRLLLGLLVAVASLPLSSPARKKGPEPVLNERGKVLEKEYSAWQFPYLWEFMWLVI